MKHIQDIEGLYDLPKPCEYFDMIGGTGAGGCVQVLVGFQPELAHLCHRIIALMLGRLGMGVQDATIQYTRFVDRFLASQSTGGDASAILKNELCRMITAFAGDEDTLLVRHDWSNVTCG